MNHVSLGSYAPSAVPIRSVPMGQTPVGPTAEMGKKAKRRSSSGCSMRRMGKVGSRCRCNGKLVKTSRCRR